MKRILIVSPFPPYLGGVSVSVQRLYDILISRGYSVVKFNTHSENVINKRSKILKYLKYISLPIFILTHKHFNVIHFHVSGLFTKLYISVWRFLFSKKTQFIITIHGEINHVLTSELGHFALSKFDKIICVKPGDSLNLPYSLKCKTVEIPAFIPPDISNNLIERIPNPLKEFLTHDTFKLLINGAIINTQKFFDLYGFKDSILLLERLRKNGKNIDLIIIILGSSPENESIAYLKTLKDYAASKDLDNYIYWVEYVNMELWPLLKKVHVLLRPTKSDGDALSIRESLYLNIPVIASNVVPRPIDTIVYDIHSESDFFNKTVSLIDNYKEFTSSLGNNNINFADKIIEQYENR
jgi:glycosyltransferase involved in cell wall biosynthesis